METQRVPYSQEISCATISWKDHSDSFLELGVLLLEFMPHKKTITEDTYASTIDTLCENIKQKCRGVLLLHDNAPAHKSCISWAVIVECGFVELNHPPYSPDLAPSDYFLFRNTKKFLCGQQFPRKL